MPIRARGRACVAVPPERRNKALHASLSHFTLATVKLNTKVGHAALLAGMVLLGVGCSGINASQSVSPATFLLPGIMQAEPPPADPAQPLPEVAPALQLAQAR